ncbi:Rhodanese-like domain [Plasmopara halstedii]|uniref:Rhodanese-like domain n=1 Tax=Plasmopara halstedii TaxID=4781 RepID=A0A0N7L7X5_PLAHL|nr:Rhodanese-like domain [Plasmopara halstedii]CEG48291.1 Rhodanese-like domain [Plasmopara halstedii]|eukprot:XP_024584660.1 Rhodanese-like domain [Plasmopara halstedii]
MPSFIRTGDLLCLRRSLLLQKRLFAGLSQVELQRQYSSFDVKVQMNGRQYISLYNYTPIDKSELPQLQKEMREQWGNLGVLGRIYIAEEGINAQIVVPQQSENAFRCSFPSLLENAKLFYGQLIDKTPVQMATEPFHKLDIRIRNQILHDGYRKGDLNLQETGKSLLPEQWHRKLKVRNDANDTDTLVLDVRNVYEHEIGRFDGATRIMVETFRDTFDALDDIFEKHEKEHDGHKPKEVMMYCTGGIRCEKIGAYLTQHKGISNVQKLHGGIINYVQYLQKQRSAAVKACAESGDAIDEVSLFKGKNFVFDQRCVAEFTESEEVTKDILGQCLQCGEPCNHHTNCSNLMCHALSLQCFKCVATMMGACSETCKHEFVKMKDMSPEEQRNYRKANGNKWKIKNPTSLSVQRFIKIRPNIMSSLQHKA